MKRIITLGIAICFALGVHAQKSMDVKTADVPAAIKTSFQKHYPAASGEDWEIKNGNYQVEFREAGNKHKAWFDNTGMRISHSTEIKLADVPAAITEVVTKNHPGSKIDDAYKVEKDGKIMYKLELDGSPDKKVVYSADGELIREKTDH